MILCACKRLSCRIFKTHSTYIVGRIDSSVPGRHIRSGEEAPAFPVETLRDWYVTPFGGLSPELGMFQIGINREALERNTSLDPTTDRVRVTVLGRVRRPILFDRFFEVVPLDKAHPDALRHSPMGEAVLPEGDQVLRPRDSPHPGDEVVLSSAASRRLGLVADSEAFAGIVQELFRSRRELDPPNS
jgi:hypothetical protein